MARINIDEKWKTDPRRTALVTRIGSRNADGMLVEITWLILAHKGLAIPYKEFKFIESFNDWIECGLAEVIDGQVYVSGSDRYRDFFAKQQSNGKKPKKARKSQTKPGKPSSSSSSSLSSSDSGSDSSLNTNAALAAYCVRFKIRWGVNPQIQGKDAGIMGRLAKGMTPSRLAYLLDAYFSMPDAGVVKAKHPINFFELKMNEVVVFADSGNFTTTTQARQADQMASNHMLMEKLKREGK